MVLLNIDFSGYKDKFSVGEYVGYFLIIATYLVQD